ncbi:transporter substrate-binding domain-containing protein [soil metagenome]
MRYITIMRTTPFACIIVALLGLVAPLAARADIKIGIAAEPFPPFSMKDASGKWTGFEIDLLNSVCGTMKETCTPVEVAWDGIIPALDAHTIDVIWSSMAVTPARAEKVLFSDYYFRTALLLAGPRNGDSDVSPAHLAGKTIGVQASTVAANYVEARYAPAGVAVKTYQTQDEATLDLSAGRVDYTLASAALLAGFLAGDEGKACCEFKAKITDTGETDGAVAAALRKDDATLAARINEAIATLSRSGDFDRMAAKYPGLGTALIGPKN